MSTLDKITELVVWVGEFLIGVALWVLAILFALKGDYTNSLLAVIGASVREGL
jgi:hypothetical protein